MDFQNLGTGRDKDTVDTDNFEDEDVSGDSSAEADAKDVESKDMGTDKGMRV